MKKKIFSFFAIIFFFGSSLQVNATKKYDNSYALSPCSLYAEYMGLLFEENGLNYWNGYFGGYGKCVDTLYG